MKARIGMSVALLSLPLLAMPSVRFWFESHMARHMLVQLPLIMLVGYWLAESYQIGKRSWLRAWNGFGLPGLLLVLLVTTFWMIPRAIDAARLLSWAEAAKFASLLVAGAALSCSWQPAGRIIQAFFLGNWCGMAAVVGLLYLRAPTRLCTVYLVDEQITAGYWLVIAGLAVFLAWCADLWRSGDLKRLFGDELSAT